VLQPPPTASRGVKEAHEQVTTGRAETPAFPARMVLTVSFVLSPVNRAFLPPSLAKADIAFANLTPASGCQDHTTSPSARNVIRLFRRRPRPSHPASRFVTIAHTPLLPRRDGASFGFDLPDGTSRIFFPRELDDPNHVDQASEISFCAQRIFAPEGVLRAARPAAKRELISPRGHDDVGAAHEATSYGGFEAEP
jgi:hypothetical protein